MDFDFSIDQNVIRQSIKEFFEKEWSMERTREVMAETSSFDPKTWKKIAELGFSGMVIPDEYDGPEGGFLELAVLMEEIGKKTVPCPIFVTACQCVPALVAHGSDSQKRKFLPSIIEQGDIWSLGVTETRADFQPADIRLSAEAKGDEFVLNGTKTFVSFANAAKYLMVVGRTGNKGNPEDGITVFMVEATSPGIKIKDVPTPAPGVKCQVGFHDVKVPMENVLGELNHGWPIVDAIIEYGGLLKAAEMLGGIQGALDLAIKYARERIQFDRPIGSFQVIQHKLVEMMMEAEVLRNQVYEAAWNISEGTPSQLLNSMAKLKANLIYHRICFDAIGIFGAIGWTAEMDVSLYLLRSRDLENDCGGSDFHRERIAKALSVRIPDFIAMQQ